MKFLLLIILHLLFNNVFAEQTECKLSIQVLGSGGPELTKNMASSSYLVWLNEKAIVMIDTGGGSAFRYGQSDAKWEDLKALLFTHFHADHSSDLPALLKASWFGSRAEDLLVFGPYGNSIMPSTKQFLDALFSENKGAFKYLADMYDDEPNNYKLVARVVEDKKPVQVLLNNDGLKIMAVQVEHGPIPTFAYIIQTCDKIIAFSGDTNGKGFKNLTLNKTDVFVAHNAIPENAGKVAKTLHMTPTQIGKIAKDLNVKKLILSHRMYRTLGKEIQTLELIRNNYQGKVEFSNDLDKFTLDK